MIVMHSPPGPQVVLEGRRYLYFAGTAYLGLQGDARVIEAGCEAMRRYGVASATSRTGFGNTPPTLEVEQLAARLLGGEESFYFVSGYVGSAILLRAMAGRFDVALVDEASHYSVMEAAQVLGRPPVTFAHRDANDLSRALRRAVDAGQRPVVMTDGLFASAGGIAPIDRYAALVEACDGAAMIVDDAHAAAVLGEHGRGSYEHAGIDARQVNASAEGRYFACATLSKAVGGFGGVIAGSSGFIGHLKRSSHYYNGASAPPIAAAGATAEAIRILLGDPSLRHRLRANVARLRSGLRRGGFEVDESPSPVIGLNIGDGDQMRRMQRQLMERGVVIAYVAAYAGLGEQGGLRIAACAGHTDAMIDQLIEGLDQVKGA